MHFHEADEPAVPGVAGEDLLDRVPVTDRREPRELPLRPLSPLGGSEWIEGDFVAARIWTE